MLLELLDQGRVRAIVAGGYSWSVTFEVCDRTAQLAGLGAKLLRLANGPLLASLLTCALVDESNRAMLVGSARVQATVVFLGRQTTNDTKLD